MSNYCTIVSIEEFFDIIRGVCVAIMRAKTSAAYGRSSKNDKKYVAPATKKKNGGTCFREEHLSSLRS